MAQLRTRVFLFSFQDSFSWVRRDFIFSASPSLNISSVPGFQLQDATRLVGIQSRMAFYKCKFLIKVGVGLQIRKEAKFPQCRSSQRTSDGRGPGWNGRWKKVRMRSPVTKELMRGESRAPRLPDMHNSVWFEICIRTWWSLAHLGTRHSGLRGSGVSHR